MTFNTAAAQQYTLASSISSTQTTITLSSFKMPVTNSNITMATMNTDIAYGTIAPGTSSPELISFTGVTQNSDGTATLTGVTRGLDRQSPYTTTVSYKQPHAGQTIFIMSDAPQVYDQYIAKSNDTTVTGQITFPAGGNAKAPKSGSSYSAPVNDLEYASKKYVDDTAVAGAPDASTSVKGIVKMSTAPVSATDPIAVGDNDTRIPTQSENDALAGTSGSPSNTNRYVTSDDTAENTASKLIRRKSDSNVTVPTTPTASTDAASKAYADTFLFTAKNGTTTYDLATASGNQIIPHGLGKTPKLVRFTYYSDSTSGTPWITWGSGAYNGTDNTSVWMTSSETMVFQSAGSSSGASLYVLNSNTSATQTATCTFDATNITLAWVKAGTPNGTVYIMWEAIA